jgi:acetyl esterase/lipase
MLFCVRMTITALLLVVAGEAHAAEPLARPTGAPPGGFGLGTGPTRDEVPRIKLYELTPDVVAGRETEMDPTEPTLDLYLPESDKETGAGVLILPGGGYQMLTVPGEGPGPARFFLANNVAAFVLRYRHGPRYHYPTTLLDAQRALRLIKSRAKEYGIDPERIGVLGASAGGHLAAMLATLHDNKLLPQAPYKPDSIDALSARPAFTLLLYPVIDLTDDAVTHRGSRTNLTQDDAALFAPLSPQLHVTRSTPPTFLVHGTNDRLVPVKNSLLFYEATVKAGVAAEMHILDDGPHGFGMADRMDDDTVKAWPTQALRFMARQKMFQESVPGSSPSQSAGDPR